VTASERPGRSSRGKGRQKRSARPREKRADFVSSSKAQERDGSPSVRAWVWAAIAAVAVGILLWQLYPVGSTVPDALSVRVVRSFPHDPEAFTQGLVWHEGKLYESTGLEGRSSLRRVNLRTGAVEHRRALDPDVFGEGLALAAGHLIQLSWRSGKAFVWDLDTFEPVREHEYRGEGWGLCYDGRRLIMSDGSAWLTFRDPDTFEQVGEVRVMRAGRPVRRLNELECVDGLVYANVWMTDDIARIDPETGNVVAWIDASGLLPAAERQGTEDVLNGIAYRADTGHLLLTGKLWPKIYEVELIPAG